MKRPPELPSPARNSSSAGAAGSKRAYQLPALVEYGSIGKLTQGGSGAFSEAAGMRRTMCL